MVVFAETNNMGNRCSNIVSYRMHITDRMFTRLSRNWINETDSDLTEMIPV